MSHHTIPSTTIHLGEGRGSGASQASGGGNGAPQESQGARYPPAEVSRQHEPGALGNRGVPQSLESHLGFHEPSQGGLANAAGIAMLPQQNQVFQNQVPETSPILAERSYATGPIPAEDREGANSTWSATIANLPEGRNGPLNLQVLGGISHAENLPAGKQSLSD